MTEKCEMTEILQKNGDDAMQKNKFRRYFGPALRVMLIILAVVFFIIGKNRGEQEITLIKAIYICLECIGIG